MEGPVPCRDSGKQLCAESDRDTGRTHRREPSFGIGYLCAERDRVELHRLKRPPLICVLVPELGDRGSHDGHGVIRGAAQQQNPGEDLGRERPLERILEELARLSQVLAGGRDVDV
jgi:hypothetical protein